MLSLKTWVRCTAVATVLAAVVGAAPAAGQGKFPFAGVITGERVKIRSGGGKNYVVLNTADKGQLVAVHGLGGARREWYRCLYPRPLLAYITTRYVKKVAEDQGVLEATRVNLRPTPSLKHPPLDQLKIGTRLKITGERNGFYEVVVPQDTVVWVHRDYVRQLGPLDKYAAQLEKIRATSLASFKPTRPKRRSPLAVRGTPRPVVPAVRGGHKAPAAGAARAAGPARAPGRKTGGKARKVAPAAAALPDPEEAVKSALLLRLEAARKRFETGSLKKDLAAVKGVLGDLNKLDAEAAKLRDGYPRFKVNQLVTRVRVAIEEMASERRVKEAVKNFPRPKKGVVTHTGWLKKETELLANRTVYKLEKGNIVLYYLVSSKYDLDKFNHKHVEVVGKVLPRKSALENAYLEVKRLKVLSQ